MTDQQFQRLMEILGQVGNQAYQSAYQQAQINGRLDLAAAGICGLVLVLAILAVIWGFRQVMNDELSADSPRSNLGAGLAFTGAVVILFALGLGSTFAWNAYSELTNPSWAAIQLLARLVRG